MLNYHFPSHNTVFLFFFFRLINSITAAIIQLDLRLNGFPSHSFARPLSFFLSPLAPSSSLFKCKCYVMRHAVSLLLSLVPEHCVCAELKRISLHSPLTHTHTYSRPAHTRVTSNDDDDDDDVSLCVFYRNCRFRLAKPLKRDEVLFGMHSGVCGRLIDVE